MCDHKLGLAEDGRALMCVLPDCRTGGKPFVMAGGNEDLGTDKNDKSKRMFETGRCLSFIARVEERMEELEQWITVMKKWAEKENAIAKKEWHEEQDEKRNKVEELKKNWDRFEF